MKIPAIWIYWIVSLSIGTHRSSFLVKRFRNYGFAAMVSFYKIGFLIPPGLSIIDESYRSK